MDFTSRSDLAIPGYIDFFVCIWQVYQALLLARQRRLHCPIHGYDRNGDEAAYR